MSRNSPDAEASRDALVRALRDGSAGAAGINAASAMLHANWPATDAALAADPLLNEFLISTPICPLWLERRLTDVRRRLLIDGGGPERLLAGLAIQGALNEFAWAMNSDEAARTEALAQRIDSPTPTETMLLAAYAPLAKVRGADGLLARGLARARRRRPRRTDHHGPHRTGPAGAHSDPDTHTGRRLRDRAGPVRDQPLSALAQGHDDRAGL